MLRAKWHYKNEGDEPNKRSTVGAVLSIAAVPTALFGAFKAAQIRVRRALYKNLAVQGVFDDLQAERSKQYDKMVSDCLEGKTPHIREAQKELEEAYHADVVERVRTLGYEKLTDQFASLKRNEKLDSILLFAGVSSITIGALLTIANQYDKYAASALENKTAEHTR